MNISELYPSKYIKADDLKGQQAPVTVMSITVEEIADKEFKPVMRFMGKEKGMVLNKTNALGCAAVWGDDTITWQGQQAILLAAPVMFQGKQVMGLQLLPKLQQQQQAGGFGAQGTAQQFQQPQGFTDAQVRGPDPYAARGPQQSSDEMSQAMHHKPGPHDAQPSPTTSGPAPAAGAQIAADVAQERVDQLARDVATAEQQPSHAVDPAGNLDDLPF